MSETSRQLVSNIRQNFYAEHTAEGHAAWREVASKVYANALRDKNVSWFELKSIFGELPNIASSADVSKNTEALASAMTQPVENFANDIQQRVNNVQEGNMLANFPLEAMIKLTHDPLANVKDIAENDTLINSIQHQTGIHVDMDERNELAALYDLPYEQRIQALHGVNLTDTVAMASMVMLHRASNRINALKKTEHETNVGGKDRAHLPAPIESPALANNDVNLKLKAASLYADTHPKTNNLLNNTSLPPVTISSDEYLKLSPQQKVNYLVADLMYRVNHPIETDVHPALWRKPEQRDLALPSAQELLKLQEMQKQVREILEKKENGEDSQTNTYPIVHKVYSGKISDAELSNTCFNVSLAVANSNHGVPTCALPQQFGLATTYEYFLAGIKDKDPRYKMAGQLSEQLLDEKLAADGLITAHKNDVELIDALIKKPNGTVGFILIQDENKAHIFNMSVDNGMFTIEDHAFKPPWKQKFSEEWRNNVLNIIDQDYGHNPSSPFGGFNDQANFILITPFSENGLQPNDVTNGQRAITLKEFADENQRQLEYQQQKAQFNANLTQLKSILKETPELLDQINRKDQVALEIQAPSWWQKMIKYDEPSR